MGETKKSLVFVSSVEAVGFKRYFHEAVIPVDDLIDDRVLL